MIERSAMLHALGSRLLRAGLLLLLLGGASACHTMEGLGQDLSALGDKLSSKSQEHDH
jgi:predicted small secreted protein